jgi:hypothetical protein
MPRLKADVRELKVRATNSLVLAIELFNRPSEHGRCEGVLIILHHAFEMLLKASIKHATGTIHEAGARYTYCFDKCLAVAFEKKQITKDERASLSILDAYRDTSAHYYQEVSEDLLYVQTQAGVTLFDDLLQRVFSERLADLIPERVLPVSTRPPKNLKVLLDSELSQVDALLTAGSRKGHQAAAKLRPIVALATASRDDSQRVAEAELQRVIAERRRGEEWSVLLPEVASLRLDTEGEGTPICLRIAKNADLAVRVAKDGEAVDGVLIKHEVNIWDKFNLSRDDIAEKLKLSGPKTSALILELKIQDDVESYRSLRRKSQEHKGYSQKALNSLRDAISAGINIDDVWARHRHEFGKSKAKKRS